MLPVTVVAVVVLVPEALKGSNSPRPSVGPAGTVNLRKVTVPLTNGGVRS